MTEQALSSKKGVLLVNLGTPDAPTIGAVFRYLNEFLTDPRVIDIPWLQRQLLVRGLIVPKRVRASTRTYRSIWTDQGSPLKIHTYALKERLSEALGECWQVEAAMRYQNPSIGSALRKLRGVKELIVIPLFPQYASATTGSVIEKVMEELKPWQIYPKLSFVDTFFDHPDVIDAYAEQARPFDLASYDKVLFSFHGLPVRQLQKGNSACKRESSCCQKNLSCYAAQCFKMADLIAKRLNLSPSQKEVAFQSRLGNEPWTEPYTSYALHQMAKEGKKRVLVLCPAFVSDCLETLFEIGVEYAEEFKTAGGETLHLVPSLNSSKTWVSALKTLITDQTSPSQQNG